MFTEPFGGKRGSIAIEAAIILPLFLLAILSLAALIRMIGAEEAVMNVYAKEAGRIAKEAYVTELSDLTEENSLMPAGPSISEALLYIRISDEVESPEYRPAARLILSNFRFLYEEHGISGLISGDLCYEARIPLPLRFNRLLEFQERLLFRAFIGSAGETNPMGFDRMEEKEEAVTVYVFPRAGERYHDASCSFIVVYPTMTLLSEQVKRNFSPCEICDPERLPIGSKVFCFHRAGKAYHRGSCPAVDRYVIPVEKKVAEEQGYTPCLKCGGGGKSVLEETK